MKVGAQPHTRGCILFNIFLLFLIVCVHVCVKGGMCTGGQLQRPEEGIVSSGTVADGGCEPPSERRD